MTHERLRSIIEGVSFGSFEPRITLEVTTKVTSTCERPAILIGIETVDAASDDGQRIRLYECFAAPDLNDERLAVWIKERCQDVILHEMDEFFRYQGEMIEMPVHPVSENVYEHVRKRQ